MKTSSTIEPLEARIAPAALVTASYNAATATLTIVSNDGALDHQVQIFPTGVNSYRVEGIDTDINTAGHSFSDIGKLTTLIIALGDGSDQAGLFNLRTLKELSFEGGGGDDELDATNLSVTGQVGFHGGTGKDTATFSGSSTIIGGFLNVNSDAGASDRFSVNLNADTTTIGIVSLTGGGGADVFGAEGFGALTIKNGINFDAKSGGGSKSDAGRVL